MMMRSLGIAMVVVTMGTATQRASAANEFSLIPVHIISAQSYLDVIAFLEEAGYQVTDMRSTLLGRLRIRAQNRIHLREVVVSRSTGEILSDRVIRDFSVGDGTAITSGKRSASDSVGSFGAGGVSIGAGTAGVSASGGGVSVGLGN